MWVRFRGEAGKDTSVTDHPPQDEDKAFFKGREGSRSQSVVPMRNLNKHLDTCCKSSTKGHKQTRFLESISILHTSTDGLPGSEAQVDLLFPKIKELVGDVVMCALECSDCEIVGVQDLDGHEEVDHRVRESRLRLLQEAGI